MHRKRKQETKAKDAQSKCKNRYVQRIISIQIPHTLHKKKAYLIDIGG